MKTNDILFCESDGFLDGVVFYKVLSVSKSEVMFSLLDAEDEITLTRPDGSFDYETRPVIRTYYTSDSYKLSDVESHLSKYNLKLKLWDGEVIMDDSYSKDEYEEMKEQAEELIVKMLKNFK